MPLPKVGKWGARYYEQTTPQVLEIVDSIASVSNVVCDDSNLADLADSICCYILVPKNA